MPQLLHGQALRLNYVNIRKGKLQIYYLHDRRDTVRFPFFVGIDEVVNSKKLPAKYYRIKNDTLRLIFSSHDNFFHFAGVQVRQKANEVMTADYLGHNIGNWKNGNLFYPEGYEPNDIKMGYREMVMMEIPLPVRKPFTTVYIRYDSFEYVGKLWNHEWKMPPGPKQPFFLTAIASGEAELIMLKDPKYLPLSKVCTRDSMLHLEYVNTSKDTLYFPFIENNDTANLDSKPLMYSRMDNGLLYLSFRNDHWPVDDKAGKPSPVQHASQYFIHANSTIKYPAPNRESGTKLAPGDKVIMEMKAPSSRPFAGLVISFGKYAYTCGICTQDCKCKAP